MSLIRSQIRGRALVQTNTYNPWSNNEKHGGTCKSRPLLTQNAPRSIHEDRNTGHPRWL
jgi:hypothetical protein